jgi:hypothetical protein
MTDYALSTSNAKQEVVEAYIEGAQQPVLDWTEVVDYRTDDQAALRLAPMTAIGRIPEWNGGDRPQTGVRALNPKTLEYQAYGLQARINKFTARDIPGLAADVARRFGIAIPTTYSLAAAECLAGAFTTETTSVDGLSLCNSAHLTKTAGLTRSNYLTSALDRTALMVAIARYRRWIDWQGLSYDLVAQGGGFVLVVPPELEEVAIECVMSSVSGSEGQVNVLSRYNIRVLVWSLLTDANDWFLFSTVETPIKFWERAAPDLVVDVIDEDSGELKMSVDFAITCEAGPTPDGIVGASVT